MVPALRELFTNGFGHVRLVAWDLDETLGPEGGWVSGSLSSYISNREELKDTIRWLDDNGVESIIVSRNSGFCDAEYAPSVRAAKRLGFQGAAHCPRRRKTNKAALASEMTGVPVENILLVDDQAVECRHAAAAGGQAIFVPHGPAIHTVPQGRFSLYVLNRHTGRVNRINV